MTDAKQRLSNYYSAILTQQQAQGNSYMALHALATAMADDKEESVTLEMDGAKVTAYALKSGGVVVLRENERILP